ncbi:MAG: hypothetical protein EA409_12380 [Saprospirales bacterium]|nr:MAG: hypothetical protein EA409_12380 [Saprospirales bacterium]
MILLQKTGTLKGRHFDYYRVKRFHRRVAKNILLMVLFKEVRIAPDFYFLRRGINGLNRFFNGSLNCPTKNKPTPGHRPLFEYSPQAITPGRINSQQTT